MRTCVTTLLLLLGFAPTFAQGEGRLAMPLEYPATRRVDHVDDYHGTKVPDPYRWLEADVRESEEVAKWVAAQNAVARDVLDRLPYRDAIESRLKQLYASPRYTAPSHQGSSYFYFRHNALENQPVLWVTENLPSPGRVLLDPNQWSADGTVAISALKISEDGGRLAYAKSAAGSDWNTVHVVDVATGKELPDVIEWVRFGSLVWNADATAFFYARYPEPAEGEKFQSVARNQKIYLHQLGTPQSADELVYERPDEPDWSFGVDAADEHRLLVMEITRSTDPQNQVLVRPLPEGPAPTTWRTLVDNFDHEYRLIGGRNGTLYFLTDRDASTKRVVAIEFAVDAKRKQTWREIVPAQEATLVEAKLVGGKLVLLYLRDVMSEVMTCGLDGSDLQKVELPGQGTIAGLKGEFDSPELFYSFTSLIVPTTVYRTDLATGATAAQFPPAADFSADGYVTRQVFVTSRDGTRIPMTLAHRADVKMDGARPTLLYAYGGFAIPVLPAFTADYAVWMEMGGVVAIPNLRGGGEYGEAWHQAGKREKKQNVFDDFIASAEWLIANKVTRSDRLAIRGGSNGGLLVGAVMTQRPELFGACLPAVGVHDMLRYQLFTAGQFWRGEFGSAEVADEFPALLAYSPYHNVRPGAAYPPTMVITADTDDRVVPMHSFKFAAALQHAQAGAAPILLRVETSAGHGAGTPVTKRIEQGVDMLAFLAELFEATPPTSWGAAE